MTSRRPPLRLLTAAALAVGMLVSIPLLSAPAQAASFRYWSYWLGKEGAWSFSPLGPGFRVPPDGSVDGWRFAVNEIRGSATPSMAPDFDSVCGTTPPQADRKRVALIVDPGTADDAPDGEQPPGAWAMCVVAAPQASGMEVLRAAAEVRLKTGFVCAIGGYPVNDCASTSTSTTPTPHRSSRAPQSSTPTQTETDSGAVAVGATTTPTPSYSMLQSPLASSPAGASSGPGGLGWFAMVAAIGVAVALGIAAIIRMRRSP